MATSTTKHPAATKRDAAITAYGEIQAKLEAAKGKGDKKTVLSLGAQLANRSREIRETSLDLAEDGVPFETWQKPVTARSRKQPPMPQPELEAKLTKTAAVYHNGDMAEDIRHTADVRIQALLKTAQKAGYQVKDPRKTK